MNIEHTFRKNKARQHVEIITDENDDYFLHVNHVEKNGSIKKTSMIIRRDLKDRITFLKNNGWIEDI